MAKDNRCWGGWRSRQSERPAVLRKKDMLSELFEVL